MSDAAAGAPPAPGPTPLLTGEHGVYLLMGTIDAESVRPERAAVSPAAEGRTAARPPVIEWILYENLQAPQRRALGRAVPPELVLLICSEGGDLDAAFALIDIMGCSQLPINSGGPFLRNETAAPGPTVGLGTIASCGLLIFIAGTILLFSGKEQYGRYEGPAGAFAKHLHHEPPVPLCGGGEDA